LSSATLSGLKASQLTDESFLHPNLLSSA
jgi:hypothetical protein